MKVLLRSDVRKETAFVHNRLVASSCSREQTSHQGRMSEKLPNSRELAENVRKRVEDLVNYERAELGTRN